jgi:hypothetical protein
MKLLSDLRDMFDGLALDANFIANSVADTSGQINTKLPNPANFARSLRGIVSKAST